jgi:LAO/AO transport system kinase
MEIADLFVVNKADRAGAEKLRQEIEITLGIRRAGRSGGQAVGRLDGQTVRRSDRGNVGESDDSEATDRPTARPPDRPPWTPPVLLTVAAKGDGVADLIEGLDRHHAWLAASGTLDARRRQRLLDRTREVVERATRRWIWDETRADERIAERLDEIVAGRVSPYEVAAEVLDGLKQGERI